MIGVITSLHLDLMAIHGEALRQYAPELTILNPDDVKDPADVEFVITFRPAADALGLYPNLRVVHSIAAGVDAIHACPSLPEGVEVLRVEDPDQALQMAGFAAFNVLWHHRRFDQHLEDRDAEYWNRPLYGRSPSSKQIGIMGFGNMGRAIAKALVALGYPVASLVRRAPDPAEPGVTTFLLSERDVFLAQTDILINVLPLTDETRGIIDTDLLAALPRGASLIQIGRGEHLNEGALLAALASGHIAGASLDVFATEPLPKGHPFWNHPRVLVTPHTASAPESKAVAQAIRANLLGLPER